MITTYLPWIAIAVGIAAVISREGKKPGEIATSTSKHVSRSAFFSLIVLALAACLAAWKWKSASGDVLPTALGFAAGLLASLLAKRLGESKFQRGAMIAGPLGLAAALSGLGELKLPDWIAGNGIGLCLGASIGAWILSSLKDQHDGWAVRFALFLNAIVVVDYLGDMGPGTSAEHTGLFIGTAIAFFAAAVPSIRSTFGKSNSADPSAVAAFCVLIAASAFLIATRYVWIHDIWKIFAGSVGVSLVVNWFVPKEPDESALPNLLAVVVWLGVATIAFGLLRGFGMSVALLGGVSVLLFFDNRPALLTLGPLAAMTVYRVFREMHTSAARALDIGQHYGLIGLIAGMALLGLLIETRRRRFENAPASAAMGVLMMGIPVVAAMLISAKGYVGLIVGMGFSSLIVGTPRLKTALPLAMQMGLGLLMAGAYGWFTAVLDLSRDGKFKAFLYAVPSLAVLAGVVIWLSRPNGQLSESSNSSPSSGAS